MIIHEPKLMDHRLLLMTHGPWVRFSGRKIEKGYNKPIGCIARQRTAVIIPYRNREDQLKMLLGSFYFRWFNIALLRYEFDESSRTIQSKTHLRPSKPNSSTPTDWLSSKYLLDAHWYNFEISLLIESPFCKVRCVLPSGRPTLFGRLHSHGRLYSPILKEYFKNCINVRMMTHIFRYS